VPDRNPVKVLEKTPIPDPNAKVLGVDPVYDSEFVDLVKKEFSCSDKIAKEYIDIYVALGKDLRIYNDLKNKYGQQNINYN